MTTNTYDNSGNLTSTKDALNHTTTFGYNPLNGQRTGMTDAMNNGTSYKYDNRGYLNKEIDAFNHVTLLANNSNGNVIARSTTRTVNGVSETLSTS